MSSYTAYSKALEKYKSRPKWQEWLGVISIFLVWIYVLKGALDRYSELPIASTVAGVILNGAMLYIWLFLITAPDSTAREIDRELGNHIEILDDELNTLKEKYETLQEEHTKLLEQASKI
jgi:hypothetical protein